MSALRRGVHYWWLWWWATVDTGGTLCQAVVYPFLWVSGIYMAVTSAPTTVRSEIGGTVHWLWIALLIICPVTCFAGQILRDQYTGRQLQLWSNVGITCALAAYVAAGLMVLTACIAIRDGRRLRVIRAHAKEL